MKWATRRGPIPVFPLQPLGKRTGQNGGDWAGADRASVEMKNVYMEANIPDTPSTAIIGTQTLTLMNWWIIGDDFSAGVLVSLYRSRRIDERD